MSSDVDADTTHRSPSIDHTPVELDVTYGTDGAPSEIEYYNVNFGLMRLSVDDGVATLSDEWDRLSDERMAKDYSKWVSTGDVLRSVQNLPFIDRIEVTT